MCGGGTRGTHADNLVANPGFESWLPQANTTLTASDVKSIPGWGVTSGDAWVLQAPSSSSSGISCQAAPFEGAAALALGGCPTVLCSGASLGTTAPQACSGDQGGKGAVVQQVNGTVPGQEYMVYLSVWAPPEGSASRPSSLTIEAVKASQTFTLAPAPAAAASPVGAQYNYVSASLKFTAAAVSTTLTISGSTPSAAIVIDSVSVVSAAPGTPACLSACQLPHSSCLFFCNFSHKVSTSGMSVPRNRAEQCLNSRALCYDHQP